MKYYWINCDNNKNRKVFMEEQFDMLNLDNIRVDAYTPDTLPTIIKPDKCIQSDLELACLCSHLKALELGLKSGNGWFVIIEDDVKILFDINYNKLTSIADADIVQLCNISRQYHFLHRKYMSGRLFVPWNKRIYGCQSYLVSRSAAEKLIKMFVKDGVYDFSELECHLVADIVMYNFVNTVTSTYPLFYNDNSINKSTIHPCNNKIHNKIMEANKKFIDSIVGPEFCGKY